MMNVAERCCVSSKQLLNLMRELRSRDRIHAAASSLETAVPCREGLSVLESEAQACPLQRSEPVDSISRDLRDDAGSAPVS
jgi:hypothetical protein